MVTYPAQIRRSLAASRDAGRSFEDAWTIAMVKHPPPDGWGPSVNPHVMSCFKFMRLHFQAAYNRDKSKRGRFRLAEPDTVTTPVRRVVVERPTPSRCQSGDECSRPVSVGRFCQFHGEELARIRVTHFSHGSFGDGRAF